MTCTDCVSRSTGGGGTVAGSWMGRMEDIHFTRAKSTSSGGGFALDGGGGHSIIRYECHHCSSSEGVLDPFACGSAVSLLTATTLQLEDALFADGNGCAILVKEGSEVTVRRANFLRGEAMIGVGMMVAGGKANIYDSTFKDNDGMMGGGAFWAHLSSSVLIVNSEISNNGAFMGAAIGVSVGADLTMRGTHVHHNGFPNGWPGWGAVCVWNAKLTIRDDCKIEHNVVRYGGGIVVGQGSTLDAESSYIGENEVTMDGAQIYLGDGSGFTEEQSNIPDEGLADPKVRLFDMNIYHHCAKERMMDMSEGSRTTTAFGYGIVRRYTDFMMGQGFPFMECEHLADPYHCDRILPFDTPLDIRNTRIALGPNCDDASNNYQIPESMMGVPAVPPDDDDRRRRLRSEFGIPENVINWAAVPGPARRLQYTPEHDDALGLPYWALPHCAQQTLTNVLTGESEAICGPQATCADEPLLKNLPPAPPSPPLACVCAVTCPLQPEYANDGDCDDGGPGAAYDYCGESGSDCDDCGPRCSLPPPPPPPPPDGHNNDRP